MATAREHPVYGDLLARPRGQSTKRESEQAMRNKSMRSIRGRLVAVAATTGALAVAGPVSAASALITPIGFPTGGGMGLGSSQGCADVSTVGAAGQIGAAGGATIQQACDAVLAFNGPSIGNVSSVIGPTIIGGPVLAPVTASTGGPTINSVP
jgi:hypothetical protein